ncbi:MAG: hypothetical protein JO191_08150 [Mycobacteriaceae bacterium]|nr:hypothetical protein [Mycobacteriaceae bacterium]
MTAVALQWYDITNQTVAAAAYPEPVTHSRAWSVSWLAAARAVGHRADSSYAIAAFAQALHDTLAAQVPSQQSQLDADLAGTLAQVPDGRSKSAGVAAGTRQAAAVLAVRRGDGLDTASLDIPFTPPPPGPGVWQPTPPSFAPAVRAGQGNARPFLLTAGGQFDPGPPPRLSSRTYLTDLNEVRAYGSADSAVRTPQQTDVALFWEPAINIQYVQLLRAVLADTGAPLGWDTRFVATFNVITTDAPIAVYHAKVKYVFWRAATAIQTGAVDPNPNWTPLFTTPRYPDWPSGHGGGRRSRPGGAHGIPRSARARADRHHQPDRPRRDSHVHRLVTDHARGDRRARLGRHPLPLLRRRRYPPRYAGSALRPAQAPSARPLKSASSRMGANT